MAVNIDAFLNQNFIVLIRRMARILNRRLDRNFAKVGLSFSEFEVLYTLSHKPYQTASHIAKCLSSERTTIGKLCKNLLAREFLESQQTELGPKAAQYYLVTQKGKDFLKEVMPRWQKEHAKHRGYIPHKIMQDLGTYLQAQKRLGEETHTEE